ncbi:MAG: M16 family metallopeptidase [Hyphomicrobiales bacterium]
MRVATVVVLFALLTGAAPASAAPNAVRTLPNKMQVVVRENRTRPLVSVQVWINAGSRDETRTERGSSMVLAQLPYLGCGKRSMEDLPKEAESFGATYGSESGYGQIVYNMTAPEEQLDHVLAILGDAVIRPRFDAATFTQAVAKARSKSRAALGTVAGASLNPIRAALYQGTPLETPFSVPEMELSALSLPIVERFYHAQFVAENVTVVVIGDVDVDQTVDKVAAAFQDLKTDRAPKKPKVSIRSMAGPVLRSLPNPEDTQGVGVTAGFRAPEWGSADALALDVLLALLVDAPGSRFEQALQSGTGDVSSALAQRSFDADGGVVSLSVASTPARLYDAEGTLIQEIEKIRSQPISKEDCDRAILSVTTREIGRRAELWGLGRATAVACFQGTPGADEVYFQRLALVTAQDLSAVARKYLDWKQAAVVEMMPSRAADSLGAAATFPKRFQEKLALYQGTYRSGPQATASDDKERAKRIDGPLASISSTPFDPGRGRVSRTTLPGGIHLLTSEDHSTPAVTVAIYLNGGVRHENDKDNGITSLLRESLLNSIDSTANGRTYRQSLGAMGSLVPYLDRDMWGVSLAMPSSQLEAGLDRLGHMFAHPDLDTLNVDATRIQILTALDNWLNDDDAQRNRLIFKTKYTVSGYRLPGIGNKVNLISMPLGTLTDFYRTYVVKPNLTIAVFGDVNPTEVETAVGKAFGDVAAGPYAPPAVPQELPFDGEREKWELGAGPTCTVQLAFDGPPAASLDMPAFYVINSLLTGPYGWFEQFVRDQPPVIGCTSIVAQAIDESPIIATLTTDGPGHEEEMVKLLLRQFKKVGGVELVGMQFSDDVSHAKLHALGTYESGFNTNTARAFQWARAELFGLPPDYPISLPAKMEAITPDDILAVGKRYFYAGQWVVRPYAIAETRPGGW